MRKFVLAAVLSACLVSAPAWPSPVGDMAYRDQLANSNPATKEAWLEGLPGPDWVTFIGKKEPGGGQKGLTDYNPGYFWDYVDYVVVKFGPYWQAFSGDGTFTTGSFPCGVSHVTFFRGSRNGNGNGVPVTEPGTLLLLGVGLIGVSATYWRR